MKFRVLSLLPNRWNEGAGIRAMLFTLILIGAVSALRGAYGLSVGNAFLISGFVAILVVYWSPPVPRENYIHWIVTHSVLVFGAYLFLFKIPPLLSGSLSYRLAQILCISIYGFCCWYLIRLKARGPSHSETAFHNEV